MALSQYVLSEKKLEMLKGIGVKSKPTSQNIQKQNSAIVFVQNAGNFTMVIYWKTPNKSMKMDFEKLALSHKQRGLRLAALHTIGRCAMLPLSTLTLAPSRTLKTDRLDFNP